MGTTLGLSLIILFIGGAQTCILITPNVLRVDSEETIVVDAQEQNSTFEAQILIREFPQKRINLAEGKVTLNDGNSFLDAVKLTIPGQNEFIDPTKKQFVTVSVNSMACKMEKVVLLSFNAGHVFIQKDKPIYNPGSKVLYRIFAMDYKLKPKERPLKVDVLSPDNIIVKQESVHVNSGVVSKAYQLTEPASLGLWTITAKYEDSLHNYTTHFEVKEYALPSFEIKLTPHKKFFHIDDEQCEIKMQARYPGGMSVNGKAFVVFGVKTENSMKNLPDSLRMEWIVDGEGKAKLRRKDLVKYFNSSEDMLGSSLYVMVSVITQSGVKMVEAMLDNIPIVKSPYKIFFTKTSKHFTPGMPFDLRVLVTYPDGSPAFRIPIVVGPGVVTGLTEKDGTAKLIINTLPDKSPMEVVVTTAKKDLPDSHQAKATMTATAYKPLPGSENYLHLSLPLAKSKLGDYVNVDFNIRSMNESIPHVTYLYNIWQAAPMREKNLLSDPRDRRGGGRRRRRRHRSSSRAATMTRRSSSQAQRTRRPCSKEVRPCKILSRGRIVVKGREEFYEGQTFRTLTLFITSDFLPSFRLVAYYVVSTRAGHEIVSDAVWVDVADSCVGTLEVIGSKASDNKAQIPGGTMRLKLRADHNAKVGLVAVDKRVYALNKKFKLSQTKVWDSFEKSDIGCTPGRGANSMQVFYDAGLAIQSNFGWETNQRTEPLCQIHEKRKPRSTVAIIEHKMTKASEYQYLEKKCCLDGMHENQMRHSCGRRATLILDGESCIKAFLDCCNYIEKKMERNLKNYNDLSIVAEGTDYMEGDNIMTRTAFLDSWLWMIETMTNRPDPAGISTKIINVFLKDSITTWEVLAVSITENKGICVSQPFDISVMPNSFIDLKLPYSVVMNEQVEIQAILYNYELNRLKVKVELFYSPEFCSQSTQKKNFQQEVHISPSSSVAVPFIIVPLSVGVHDIEVKTTGELKVVIKKKLKVVPEGMRLTQALKSVTLEPERKGKDGLQIENVSSLNETNIVPGMDDDTIITIQGSLVNQMVEDAINGANLNHFIIMPAGSGEQNMMNMSPGVIATHYLDATNHWERIGLDRRAQALDFINRGYSQQLTYRKADHSYSMSVYLPSSTWLTAYVVKVFAMAYPLLNIDKDTLCNSVAWLISKEDQTMPGKFDEIHWVYYPDIKGGLRNSSEPDAVLTAFVLIALLESQSICQSRVKELQTSISNATNFLLEQYPNLQKPYSIAVTSYALALDGKLNDTKILMNATTDTTHWDERGSRMLSLEATAYGLLTLLRMKQYNETGAIARWLIEHRYRGEVQASAQATIMMFQALTQYQLDRPSLQNTEMDISIEIPKRKEPITYRINNQNALMTRSEQIKTNRPFAVKANGTGQATLTVVSVYYTLVTEKLRKCNNFDLSITVKEEPWVRRPEETINTLSVIVCFRFLKSYDASMSILDVSMLTGFFPDVDGLNKLMNGVDRYIFRYEINKEATDKGTLLIYLDKASHTEEQCLKFHIHQYFKVGNIQPASVTLYDYYTPENRCTKFYNVEEGNTLLEMICPREVCDCAQAMYTSLGKKHGLSGGRTTAMPGSKE